MHRSSNIPSLVHSVRTHTDHEDLHLLVISLRDHTIGGGSIDKAQLSVFWPALTAGGDVVAIE